MAAIYNQQTVTSECLLIGEVKWVYFPNVQTRMMEPLAHVQSAGEIKGVRCDVEEGVGPTRPQEGSSLKSSWQPSIWPGPCTQPLFHSMNALLSSTPENL